MKTEVLIIGGGVIGASIAHQLAKYNLDIILVEKASDVCMGTSKANSAMIHSGFNIDGGTLKGKLALAANKVVKQLCQDLDVDLVKPLGSITVGFEDSDLEKMKKTMENGIKNGIQGMRLLDQKELHEMEPHLNPEAKYGLFEPETGIINPFEYTVALAENAVINGAKVMLDTEVLDIMIENKTVKGVKTNKGDIEAKVIINAAGLYADKIAAMVEDIDFEIKPRKGQYFLYDKKWGNILTYTIYSAPTKVSKGMIVVPTIDGNILAGSNAEALEDKTDLRTTAEALDQIYTSTISHLFPELPRMGDVITTFTGLRAASSNEDFIIEAAKTVKGMINVAGIQSPGLTSAPAIAVMVEELVRAQNLELDFTPKANYEKGRKAPVMLAELSYDERNALIEKEPAYGEIICRCESISKGEIKDAIHRPVPATNMDAIKRRVRAGMGRCQGGFCGPKVLDILSRELNISPLEVTQKGNASFVLAARNKELPLAEGDQKNEKIRI
ncbi:NAD(P)/FAD-dependent oxidoreductase [Acetobacterium wieringae]|uniref:NAD(P)/FAD-dependent oxidoreductase n=1 Tax=Acetobacterium wieringae TaxID=52694 RepID=A0ABY6HC65_9FIRM|nr:NAD(P)/FAD-dependent oxidoreductase [Acetobacterium wieringae]UYO61935.1 NAD(P)/FAD-dependent oxidoreductase [Acetobacterium wieringae]VUZ28010.1 L-2-hydroxyglutarate oxidase LhgO [Acetobacterium wieringae]